MQQNRNSWSENSLLKNQLPFLSTEAKDLLDAMFEVDEGKRIDLVGGCRGRRMQGVEGQTGSSAACMLPVLDSMFEQHEGKLVGAGTSRVSAGRFLADLRQGLCLRVWAMCRVFAVMMDEPREYHKYVNIPALCLGVMALASSLRPASSRQTPVQTDMSWAMCTHAGIKAHAWFNTPMQPVYEDALRKLQTEQDAAEKRVCEHLLCSAVFMLSLGAAIVATVYAVLHAAFYTRGPALESPTLPVCFLCFAYSGLSVILHNSSPAVCTHSLK